MLMSLIKVKQTAKDFVRFYCILSREMHNHLESCIVSLKAHFLLKGLSMFSVVMFL